MKPAGGGWKAGLVMIVLSAVPSTATETPAPDAEGEAVHAWGETHPECREWSDACVICRRSDAVACSTPGIACISTTTVCRQLAPTSRPN